MTAGHVLRASDWTRRDLLAPFRQAPCTAECSPVYARPGLYSSKPKEENMASGASIEILDLRHFAAPVLRPVLDAEGELWKQRLHWDYRASAKPAHAVSRQPHAARLRAPSRPARSPAMPSASTRRPRPSSAMSLPCPAVAARRTPYGAGPRPSRSRRPCSRHLFETLLNSPQVDRIESQLLLHPSGRHSGALPRLGFEIFRRLFMVQQLRGPLEPRLLSTCPPISNSAPGATTI